MTEFTICYTKKVYCSCTITAQNKEQLQFLFDHDMLDLCYERINGSDLEKIDSIEEIGE